MAGDESKGADGATVQKSDAPAPAPVAGAKVREFRVIETGFGMADRVDARVRALGAGETIAAGAESVPADTPDSDWTVYGQGRPDGVEVSRG